MFIERPFVIEAFNEDARRLGILMYGLSEDKAWNWRYGVFNMQNLSTSGNYVGDHVQPEVAGRLANTALWEDDGKRYFHWAAAASYAFPDGDVSNGDANNAGRFRTRPESRTASRWLNTGRIDGIDSYQLGALEAVWNDGPTQIVAEYQNTWVSRDDGSDLKFSGGYVQAAYFLTGEHMPWSRKSGTIGRPKPNNNFNAGNGWGALQFAARYSTADFSNEDIRGGLGESITLALNWYFNPNASLQLNYIRTDISQRDEDIGGTSFGSGDSEIVGIRLRADF